MEDRFTYKIAEARKAKGWTQEQLAALVGVSQQAIQRYETGQRDIRASMLVKLSMVLNVTVTYLLGMTEPTPAAPAAVEVPLYSSKDADRLPNMGAVDKLYPIPSDIHARWPNAFLLHMEDESMNRILPNDCYALVNPCTAIDYDGQPYAVHTDSPAITIRRVRKLINSYELVPDSDDPAFRAKILRHGDGDMDRISIIGRVVWHYIPRDWRY